MSIEYSFCRAATNNVSGLETKNAFNQGVSDDEALTDREEVVRMCVHTRNQDKHHRYVMAPTTTTTKKSHPVLFGKWPYMKLLIDWYKPKIMTKNPNPTPKRQAATPHGPMHGPGDNGRNFPGLITPPDILLLRSIRRGSTSAGSNDKNLFRSPGLGG